jgi:plastocyanin
VKSPLIEKLGSAAAFAAALFLMPTPGRSTQKAGPKIHVVIIEGMVFKPHSMHVAIGDTVIWENHDIVIHAVKSADAKHPWQTKDIAPHESATEVISQADAYICPYHPTMTAEIVVDP